MVGLIKATYTKIVSQKHKDGENIDSNSNQRTLSKNTYILSTNENHKLLNFYQIKLLVMHNHNYIILVFNQQPIWYIIISISKKKKCANDSSVNKVFFKYATNIIVKTSTK